MERNVCKSLMHFAFMYHFLFITRDRNRNYIFCLNVYYTEKGFQINYVYILIKFTFHIKVLFFKLINSP
jgi:hypothetical protein